MPFWKKNSPEDEAARIAAQQEAEASRQAIEAGGLPLKARKRLQEEVAAGHPLFSSDLSTKEFSLTRSLGYQPLSQVMGSSIYQVGWQYQRNYVYNTRFSELNVLTQAHQHAAQLALSRLDQEASLLKAHGVIGVRLNARGYEWGQNLIEYTAIGTAIRLPNVPLPSHPFLSDLSGQEFWTLIQAGYYPVGIAFGYCSYYVQLGSNYTNQLKSWYRGGTFNQEITPFSQGIYDSRHLAEQRVVEMAKRFNAFGVVGMHIDCRREVIEYEQERENYPTQYYMDLSIHFSAIGTAITAQRKDHVIASPKPTLTFTDLRMGRRGETSELTISE